MAATKIAAVPLGLKMSHMPKQINENVSRRSTIAVFTSGLIALMSPSQVSAAGAWAKHEGPFADSDFEGFSSTSSGLKFYDVEVGTGPMPNPGQKIKAHYSGYLLSGKKFDSSYDRGQPLPFNVGKGQVCDLY
jgi:FKBP-type peptidyl-prolyl cis-trans isomerase